MKTPKTEKKQAEIAEKEKTSGKKLVQARLPFKILSTPTASDATTARNDTENDTSEARKRKLSYDNEDGTASQVTKKKSLKSVSENYVEKSKKNSDVGGLSSKPADVVLLSDSNDEGDVLCSKENVKTVMTTKAKMLKQTFESDHEADMHSDDVELVESTDEEVQKLEPATPVKPIADKQISLMNRTNEKKAITPKGAGKSNGKTDRKSLGDATTEKPKVLIKLPVTGKKNKRRKNSVRQSENAKEHIDCEDVEPASPVTQPQKRAKLEDDVEPQRSIVKEVEVVAEPPTKVEKQRKDSENDKATEDEKMETTPKKEETTKATAPEINTTKESTEEIKSLQNDKKEELNNPTTPEKRSSNDEDIKNTEEALKIKPADEAQTKKSENVQVDLEEVASEKSPKDTPAASDEETTTESDTNKSKIQEVSSSTDADAETETTINKDAGQSEANATSSVKTPKTPKISNESAAGNILQKKNLTPKQQKLLEQRLKAREEKERKIQEERLQKQREKEERELAKKREREEKDEQKRKEREEKEEQRRKEREEKEEQRRKERDEKERKRLAEIEMKNEEKRKRNEAKEEELRKKEEERKRKEQEKEEAELKKKKAAMAFTKFFSRPSTASTAQSCKTQQEDKKEEDVVLAFRPFQIKGAMKLAPTVRKQLTNAAISTLDTILEQNAEAAKEKLYLQQLKTGAIKTHKWVRPTQKDAEDTKLEAESDDDDVIIIESELERAGQAIVEEPVVPVERLRVKYFKFAENRRPPYYGTWRKKSQAITPRRPFVQDKKYFDYEVDSDDEWEEEEPGESLDGSDDDKEKESEDEDYEVDNEWFVPHGHLSDEEMQGEDDLGENNDREAQKAKLQILQKEFAQEMKKKTEKIKPRLIGCIWVDENGNQPELCPKIIWDTLNTRAILCAEPPVLEEIEAVSDKNSEANATKAQCGEKSSGEVKLKPFTLNGDILKQLVKLLHGNTHSKNFIIKEFIAYIEAKEESVRNGDVKGPLKSAVREKIDEFAQWQVIEKTDDDKDNVSSAKKKKNKKKLCWVVSAEKLREMELENLDLNNNWEYTLQPREPKPKAKAESVLITLAQGEDSNEHSEASVEQTNSPSTKTKPKADIKKFTKVLTAAEKAQQLQKLNESARTPSTKAATVTTTPSSASAKQTANSTNNNNTTPTVKKRVPLLMSVARGQTISTPDKNARISQFLKNLNEAKQKEKSQPQPTNDATPPIPMDVDEVVILD